MQSKKQFDRYMQDWTSPTETNPDIYSTQTDPTCFAHPEKHSNGKQLPRTGNCMVSIKTQGTGGKKKNHVPWHEYIQAKLTKPLETGKKYYAEVWVQRVMVSSRASNNIGIYFSESLINTRNRLPICLQPHINHDKVIESKNHLWEKVSGVFMAESAAQYIIIGNFYSNEETKIIKMPEGKNDAHYYLDDVLVRPATEIEGPTPIPPVCTAPTKVEVKKMTTTKELDLTKIEFKKGNHIELSNIYFETGKSELLPESMTELTKLYNMMYNYPYMEIEINGHTDNVGADEYNINLSKDRANAVVVYLLKKKIDERRIAHNGYGRTLPVATNDTEEGREKNRRVEFVITKM